MIGLLARWSGDFPNKGGLRNIQGRSAVRHILLSIITLGFPEGSTCPMNIYLSGASRWQPPGFPEGTS
eukprot:998150-Prorocentrum_lima.AAC.1